MSRWIRHRSGDGRSRLTVQLLALLTVAVLLLGVATAAAAAPGKGKAGGGKVKTDEHEHKRDLGFDDLEEASWAKGYMTLMAAKGIFQGRGHGKMAPQATVTRAEALTAIVRLRLLAAGSATVDGAGDSLTPDEYARAEFEAAGDFAFNFTDGGVLTRGAARWAQPYVYLAVRWGVIENAGALQPMAAAHRAWVAEILVRTLDGLITVDETTGAITFTDTGNLPAETVSYIEAAVRAGLFQGYPDGTFGPGKPLTRAELMALMARADEEHALAPGGDVYRGVITAIDESEGSVAAITVRLRGDRDGDRDDDEDEDRDSEDEDADEEESVSDDVYDGDDEPAELTFAVDEGTQVFVKGQERMVAVLQVGDRVHVLAAEDEDGSLVADVIWATFERWEVLGVLRSAADGTVTVEVREVEEPDEGELPEGVSEGAEATFDVADDAMVRIRGDEHPYDPALLSEGDVVELKLHGSLVDEIVLEERSEREQEIEGEIVQVNGSEVTILVTENDEDDPVEVDASGHYTFIVTDETEIRLRGRQADLSAIAPGDEVEVKIEDGTVVRVTIEDSDEDDDDDEGEDEEEADEAERD